MESSLTKTILLTNKDTLLPKINLKYNLKELNSNINKDEYNKLIFYKNKIDKVNNHKIWDKAKKFSNNYELIHIPNKQNKSESIAFYKPLSRSYFKLWEIIYDFNLLKDSENKLIMCGLAEGPGGFIEAFVNYRKKTNKNKTDKIYGITLKSLNKDIPGWKKSAEFLNNNINVTISYGKDNTGNLYNIDNIKSFRKLVNNNNVDFITADGGFDFSIDFNKQEKLAQRMIYCEIVTALSIQKKDGIFILKIFDIYTDITIQFIYLLSYFYKEVYITKPLTSRPANSEKYLVCKGFKGIEIEYLENLFIIVKKWNIIEKIGRSVNSIFDIKQNEITNDILKYNKTNTELQISNINKTLNIIDNQKNLTLLNKIISNQTNLAYNWCKTYQVEINTKSNFLK